MSEFIYTQEDFDDLEERYALGIAALESEIHDLETEIRYLTEENKDMMDEMRELDYQINEMRNRSYDD